MIRVSWEEKELEGIVTERTLNADSGEGPWESLLCLETA